MSARFGILLEKLLVLDYIKRFLIKKSVLDEKENIIWGMWKREVFFKYSSFENDNGGKYVFLLSKTLT